MATPVTSVGEDIHIQGTGIPEDYDGGSYSEDYLKKGFDQAAVDGDPGGPVRQ